MRGIDLLLERNLPLKLKTVAVSINKHEIPAMKQMAADRGVEFKFDAMINPRIDCSASPLAVRLTPSEIVELDLDDAEHVSEWKRLATDHAQPAYVEGELKSLYDCGGGISTFAVDPYGELSICVLSHKDSYNVRDGNFREGWQDYIRGVRSRKITRPTKCTGCGLKSMCGMCAANGELENGDAESPVDFLCEVAHLRAMTLDIRYDVTARANTALTAFVTSRFVKRPRRSNRASRKRSQPFRSRRSKRPDVAQGAVAVVRLLALLLTDTRRRNAKAGNQRKEAVREAGGEAFSATPGRGCSRVLQDQRVFGRQRRRLPWRLRLPDSRLVNPLPMSSRSELIRIAGITLRVRYVDESLRRPLSKR